MTQNTRHKIAVIISLLFFCSTPGQDTREITAAKVIDKLQQNWDILEDCTLEMETYIKYCDDEHTRYYDYKFKKPKWIWVEIIDGPGKGTKLVHNPETNKTNVRASGILGLIPLSFSPDNPRIQSKRGHRTDNNHLGYIIERWQNYLECCAPTIEIRDSVYVLDASGIDTIRFNGAYREVLFVDVELFSPMRYEQYSLSGELIHRVSLFKIEHNVGLTLEDFGI